MNDISLLKQALPYLRHHKKSTMVVKLGGEIAANREALRSLAEDVSLLTHVGIRIVLVHGGGPQATEMQKRLGLEPIMVGGRRVTDEATLDVAKMIFAGKINTDILSALRGQGVSAVGLSGVDGDILHATKRPPTEVTDPATGEKRIVDYGLVGDIRAVDTSLLLASLLENKYVPVLASLASDGDGEILNVNADTVASVIAKDLQASKLGDPDGRPGPAARQQRPVDPGQPHHDRGGEGGHPGRHRGGRHAAEAQGAGRRGRGRRGPRPHLSGTTPGAVLLELFTSTGCGTLIAEPHDLSEIVDGGPRMRGRARPSCAAGRARRASRRSPRERGRRPARESVRIASPSGEERRATMVLCGDASRRSRSSATCSSSSRGRRGPPRTAGCSSAPTTTRCPWARWMRPPARRRDRGRQGLRPREQRREGLHRRDDGRARGHGPDPAARSASSSRSSATRRPAARASRSSRPIFPASPPP